MRIKFLIDRLDPTERKSHTLARLQDLISALIDNADPDESSPKMLNVPFILDFEPARLQLLPTRRKLLNDTDEPQCRKLRTDKELERAPNPRTDRALPIVLGSMTDN
jgi:hypothetical protein